MVFDNYIIPAEQPLYPEDTMIYILHENRDPLDNCAVNLQEATYDEYYAHMEYGMSSQLVQTRDIRVHQEEFMRNPYRCIPKQGWHTVDTEGVVKASKKVGSSMRDSVMVQARYKGKGLVVELFKMIDGKQRESRLRITVAELVLQAFVGFPESDKQHIIYQDGDRFNPKLSNLLYATEEEYVNHHINMMKKKYPEEAFTRVNSSICGDKHIYLMSSKGRCYNVDLDQEIHGYKYGDQTDNIMGLGGKAILLKNALWIIWRGEIPRGYSVQPTTRSTNIDIEFLQLVPLGFATEDHKRKLFEDKEKDVPEQGDLDDESWRPLDKAIYEMRQIQSSTRVMVSNNAGRVKVDGIVQKPYRHQGYEVLRIDEVDYSVHRMVAITWVPNTDMKKYIFVNHKSKERNDNRAANLEWVTPRENSTHGRGHPVLVTDTRNGNQYYYPSQRHAAEILSKSTTTIAEAVNKRSVLDGVLRLEPGNVYESVREMYANENVEGLPKLVEL
ncbi:hypothetical protein FB192DRAFT_1448496 [Mucor lusitanicus]|nr:hypothetical protein FB192DRAFT_1448496 [Mucor lusitanicus]